jgi:two-component system sporulation sensor kinase C
MDNYFFIGNCKNFSEMILLDLMYLVANAETTGLLSIVLVYVYLFALYRERCMGILTAGWFLLFVRIVILDSAAFNLKNSEIGLVLYVLQSIFACILLLWSTSIFAEKPLNSLWVYGAGIATVISCTVGFMNVPLLGKLLTAACYVGAVYIWMGVLYLKHLKEGNKVGKKVVGYSSILWGLHTLEMPFLITIAWFAPWGYLIGGTLRLIIAFGILVLYFENTRSALVRKETEQRLLTENAVDVIYRYRVLPEAKFEYISPSIFEVTGYTPEEYYADAKLFTKLIHYEDLSMFKKHTDNSWTNDLPLEYRLIHKNGHNVWIEQNFNPVHDEKGKLIMREGILRNVTARNYIEQIETQFDRMNMVGEMAVTVAHEVCNPLTTIRGYLQFSRGKKNLCEDRFDLMIGELDRISSIINEYLLLAQNKKVDLKSSCLNSIIKKLLPLIETYNIDDDIHIKLELGDVPEILIDENDIRYMVINLVRNGFEAMPLGGELTICTKLEQKQVILSIKDQGVGISTHLLDEIGTPFVTTKNTGTGLGLPTCYRIAERHNANIDIKTNDKGTTFFVYFNLVRRVA